jgi:hypothetical protein
VKLSPCAMNCHHFLPIHKNILCRNHKIIYQSTNFSYYTFTAAPNHFDIQGPGWLDELRSLDLTAHTSLSPIRREFAPSFVNYKKGALDSQPQVTRFTSCLPRVGGSLRVLRFPPPLKLVAMI